MKKKDKDFVEENLYHLKNTINILDEGIQEHNWNKRDLIAMGTCLANIYNGYENIFRTILDSRDVEIPKGEQWHRGLLKTAKSENLVPDEMSMTIEEMLGFRHYQVHGYSYTLDEKTIRESSHEVVQDYPIFEKHIEEIMKEMTVEDNKKNTQYTYNTDSIEITDKTDKAHITHETDNDSQKAHLQSEAIKNRLQAQAAQEIISKARAIPQGTDKFIIVNPDNMMLDSERGGDNGGWVDINYYNPDSTDIVFRYTHATRKDAENDLRSYQEENKGQMNKGKIVTEKEMLNVLANIKGKDEEFLQNASYFFPEYDDNVSSDEVAALIIPKDNKKIKMFDNKISESLKEASDIS